MAEWIGRSGNLYEGRALDVGCGLGDNAEALKSGAFWFYYRLGFDLTEERRKELAKLAGQYAEKAKIAIRNVRRDAMESLKADEKAKDISEDDRKRSEDEVQKLTDTYVAQTDEAAAKKEQEILTQ